jgi:tellurite resistance protein TehA-like permease
MPARKTLESLHPGNFAMVMATGIISIGLDALHFELLAGIFKGIALFGWVILIILCLVRVTRYYRAVFIDLKTPRMVFSYFTLVAATDIVGMLLHDSGYSSLALACWLIAFVFWCLLLYMAFSVLTFLSHENNVNIMHGGWLITIVGTQSLVLLGTTIAPDFGEYAHYMMVEVHMLWGLGLSLYGIFVALFCYRIFFLSLKPQDLSPLLWVVMGAAAISANAGTSLFWTDSQLPFLAAQKPFIDGVTLMIWSWATWWIPLLFLFGVWKHAINKIPFKYEPSLWSMVFPLGMYTVASVRLGQAAEFPPMIWIAQLMIWVAIGTWILVMAGMIRQILKLNQAQDEHSV